MEIRVSEYIDLEKKATELGSSVPNGLTILPKNFEDAQSFDELVHEETVATTRVILRQAGIIETKLEQNDTKIPSGVKKSFDWISPIIFVGSNIGIPMIVNLISNYLYEFLKGHPDDTEATLEFVKESSEQTKKGKSRKYLRITIKGKPKELLEIDDEKLEILMKKFDK